MELAKEHRSRSRKRKKQSNSGLDGIDHKNNLLLHSNAFERHEYIEHKTRHVSSANLRCKKKISKHTKKHKRSISSSSTASSSSSTSVSSSVSSHASSSSKKPNKRKDKKGKHMMTIDSKSRKKEDKSIDSSLLSPPLSAQPEFNLHFTEKSSQSVSLPSAMKLKGRISRICEKCNKSNQCVVATCNQVKKPSDKLPLVGPSPRVMKPMTREEWEKEQSILRHVFDEETGRTRLIKGDGEVMEEMVGRQRQKAITKAATHADGNFFQSGMDLL